MEHEWWSLRLVVGGSVADWAEVSQTENRETLGRVEKKRSCVDF